MQAGKPGFQSLEQLHGEDMGITCDIYALGGILTEFWNAAIMREPEQLHYHIFGSTEGRITHLPQEVQKIVQVCLCSATNRATAVTVLSMLRALDH